MYAVEVAAEYPHRKGTGRMETMYREPHQGNGACIVGAYRYLLWRTWDVTHPRLLWVLLNPSTADGQIDDPTLCRCMDFSRGWGYGGLEIANLFAFRATYPQDLRRTLDPVGPENDQYLAAAAGRAAGIIVAWGKQGTYQLRDRAVLALLSQHAAQSLQCIGAVQNGCPRHPLYLARSTSRQPYLAR